MMRLYSVRSRFCIWIIGLMGLVCCGPVQAQQQTIFCQILDRPDDTMWYLSGGYAEGGRVAGGPRLRMLETRAGTGLYYARTPLGEFDLRAKLDATTFIASGDLRMPDQIAALRLDLDYIARLEDGYALRLGYAPGFYSQITHVELNHLYHPFLIHGLYSFSPEATAVFGFNIYPGFGRLLEPRAGVRWEISDFLLLDVFYPASEATFLPAVGWALRAGVDFKRKYEYRLKSSDDRDSLIMKETRLYVGVDRMITPQLRIMVRLGRIVDRDLDFKRGQPARGIEDATFFQIGIGGVI